MRNVCGNRQLALQTQPPARSPPLPARRPAARSLPARPPSRAGPRGRQSARARARVRAMVPDGCPHVDSVESRPPRGIHVVQLACTALLPRDRRSNAFAPRARKCERCVSVVCVVLTHVRALRRNRDGALLQRSVVLLTRMGFRQVLGGGDNMQEAM